MWLDDNEFRDSIELFSARWVRDGLPSDAIAARSVLPLEVFEQFGPNVWPSNLHNALDSVEPSIVAASRSDEQDCEHAQSGSDAPTLCVIPGREVVLYRYHFAAAEGDCARCRELVWTYEPASARRPRDEQSAEGQRLSELWRRQWPERRPIPYELRGHDRWVRVPQHAGVEAVRRHRQRVPRAAATPPRCPSDLAISTLTGEVLVVSASCSGGVTPTPRFAPLASAFSEAVWWESHCTDDDPDFPVWTHLWLGGCTLDDPRLETLLRIVADDQTRDVLLVDRRRRPRHHAGATGRAEGAVRRRVTAS